MAGDGRQEAASLIKLFVAGTVYEQQDNLAGQENYTGETKALVRSMIRVSDNEAANTLVRRLGSGDAAAGMQKVNELLRGTWILGYSYGKAAFGF